MSEWIFDDRPSDRYPIYSRGNVGETFAHPVSPLTLDLISFRGYDLGWRDALVRTGAFEHNEFAPDSNETCACFCGYYYINLSISRVLAVRTPGVSVEVMDQSFFGDQPAPPYTPDPRDEDSEREAEVLKWLGSVLSATDKSFPDTFEDSIALEHLRLPESRLREMGETELIERALDLSSKMRLYFSRHIFFLYSANVAAGQVTVLCDQVGLPEASTAILAQLGNVESVGPSTAIWDLSRLVRGSSELTALFDAGLEGLFDRLAVSPSNAEFDRFRDDWVAFLDRFGCYGENMWDLAAPRFASHPERALRLIDSSRKAGDEASPSARRSRLQGRLGQIDEVANRFLNSELRDQFLAAATASSCLLPSRERAKSNCVKLLNEIRMAVRELARRHVDRGNLTAIDDIFMLTADEIAGLDSRGDALRVAVTERHEQLQRLEQLEPAFVFTGEVPQIATLNSRSKSRLPVTNAVVELKGIGASPGRVQSRARVILDLEDADKLEPGDILVTQITDVAWGPLFLTAGAVVVETGAIISHAAILARELGIPCVVSAIDATSLIADDALVTVDGASGLVTLDG